MLGVDLSTRECDGRVIAALRGELDVLDAAGVAGALAAVTAREPRVIVDLAGLGFIDASGLAALVSARKQARRAGGDLLLAAPQRRVLEVLAVTGLLDLFGVHLSVEAAACGAGFSTAAWRWRSSLAARPNFRWPWCVLTESAAGSGRGLRCVVGPAVTGCVWPERGWWQ